MAVFCTECTLACRYACLQALRLLPHHDWRGILHEHHGNLWLSPVYLMFQCSGIPAIVDYFNAVAIGDEDRASMALRSIRDISILLDMPGVALVPIDRVRQLPPLPSPGA